MTDDWLRLAWVGMHPDRVRGLLEDRGSPRAVLEAIKTGRVTVPPHAKAAADRSPRQLRNQLAELSVDFLVQTEPGFPSAFGDTQDGPRWLFVKGVLADEPGVGIVGTRKCTRYGRDVAAALAKAVSDAGWVVVSGLARGIDGAAHRGSLAGPTPGVAVLGCGIDRWYPTSHAGLGRAMIDTGGAVVSEYPPGTPPTGWRFPPRNRIISGLASAVVVVEAGVKGGALITAHRALDQARVVLAVPGDITRATSEGCNLLIRDGAIPVLGPEDLVETLSLILGLPPNQVVRAEPDPIGVGGISVEELAVAEGVDVSKMLATLGHQVSEGTVEIREGRVYRRRARSQPSEPDSEQG